MACAVPCTTCDRLGVSERSISVSEALERAKRHGWRVLEWYDGGILLTHRATRWGVRILYDTVPRQGILLTSIDRV